MFSCCWLGQLAQKHVLVLVTIFLVNLFRVFGLLLIALVVYGRIKWRAIDFVIGHHLHVESVPTAWILINFRIVSNFFQRLLSNFLELFHCRYIVIPLENTVGTLLMVSVLEWLPRIVENDSVVFNSGLLTKNRSPVHICEILFIPLCIISLLHPART